MKKEPLFLEEPYFTKQLNCKKMLYVGDIKHTLQSLKILDKKSKLKKKDLIEKLKTYYESKKYYENNIDKIIFLQRKIKAFLKTKKTNYYSQFTNSEDFYTLEPIENIDKEKLFWYEDENKFKFAFDIYSFQQLISKKCKNPYNRSNIPQYARQKFQKQLQELKSKKIEIKTNEDVLTFNQSVNARVVDVFHKLEELDVVAGGINKTWFQNFSLDKLKNLYRVLEDVWNYRAELSLSKKIQIDPHNMAFKHSIASIFRIQYTQYNYYYLLNIVLTEMNNLITSGIDMENKKLGGYYVMIALTEVSREYADCYPWLRQY